jgi:hypothetical protein
MTMCADFTFGCVHACRGLSWGRGPASKRFSALFQAAQCLVVIRRRFEVAQVVIPRSNQVCWCSFCLPHSWQHSTSSSICGRCHGCPNRAKFCWSMRSARSPSRRLTKSPGDLQRLMDSERAKARGAPGASRSRHFRQENGTRKRRRRRSSRLCNPCAVPNRA